MTHIPTTFCNGFANCGQDPVWPVVFITTIAIMLLVLLHRRLPEAQP